MRFNQYTWNLYKSTSNGQKIICEFEDVESCALVEKYNPYFIKFIDRNIYKDVLENIFVYGISDNEVPTNLSEAKELYECLISLGIRIEGEVWLPYNDYKLMLGYITPISSMLYYFAPEYFVPYYFVYRFFELNKIADTFDIDLPPVPKKADYKARCMYYWQLCEAFFKFRIKNELSPAELCAFLYDYAFNQSKTGERTEIPRSSQAWFIGGRTEVYEQNLDILFWQANSQTQKGDILVHYETSPISAITCLWIAQTDGVIDPFFHYYSNTYISGKIDIPHITLKELQADEYFSKHPLIRKKFQGVNGWPMSSEDYSELLRMIKAKGFDIDTLPKLYAPTLPKNISIVHERDVETQLLEPLLNSMELYENKDFIRQLPIHAGRGYRIFPDYALHYDNKPNEEKAKVLIEAKLYMKNNQEVEGAFLQARSYACLLESSVIVLCDKHSLIVYEKKQSFDRNDYKKYYWGELENPDIFNELKNKLL